MKRIIYTLICLIALPAFSDGIVKQGLQAKKTLQTPKYYDCRIFDLKGPVKSVSTNTSIESDNVFGINTDMGLGFCMENHSFTFQEDGLWRKNTATISLAGPYPFTIIRTSDGKIKELKGNKSWPEILILFEWKDSQITQMEYKYDGDAEGNSIVITEYAYNNGEVVSMKYRSNDCEGDCDYTDCNVIVNDVKKDNYGNWISRRLNIAGTYQYSSYDSAKGREAMISKPINASILQIRNIEYW